MARSSRFVQFSEPISDVEHRRNSRHLAAHPDGVLRVFGNYGGQITDLEWLEHYPGIGGFRIDSMYGTVPDLDGLRHLPDDLRVIDLMVPSGRHGETLLRRCTQIEELGIAQHRRLPAGMAGLTNLETLYVEGPVKDLDPLATLTTVRDLTLRSVSVPDLSALLSMRDLAHLDIKLGGIRDLSLLPALGPLRYLELWMIRGLNDISPIGAVSTLEELKLESLRQVTTVPDLSAMPALRRINLGNMKGLRDLAPIAAAPALEHLWVWEASHLSPDDFAPFVDHPTLRTASIGLGSDRKNRAVRDLLGLPEGD